MGWILGTEGIVINISCESVICIPNIFQVLEDYTGFLSKELHSEASLMNSSLKQLIHLVARRCGVL